MQVFESKVDFWFYSLMAVLILLSIYVLHRTVRQPSAVNLIASVAISLLGVGLPMWLLATTEYIVNSEELLIRSGPVKKTIPLSSIISVNETRNPISSPALSLDRLEIIYANDKRVIISPKDKVAFRQAIGHQ